MLNIAYVGFGKSTNRYHLPYIKQRLDKFKVTRIVTPHLGKRPDQQAEWEALGTVFSTDLATIIDDDTIDLVVVVTPAPSHFATVKTLLTAGKNVMVDKPMVTSLAEADELIALANAQKLLLMPFQNRRFDSDYLTIQHVLKAGYVGRPVELELHMDHYRPEAGQATGTPIDGAWYGHGVHLVDQIVALFGTPQKVSYDLRATRLKVAEIDDQFEVGMFYPDAFKATVQATELAATHYPKWLLHGTKGTYIKYNIDQQEYDLKTGIMPGDQGFGADAPQDYGQVVYYNQNGDRLEKVIPTVPGDYGMVYDTVFESIAHDQPKLVSDEQIRAVITILAGGYPNNGPHVKEL
ncbi:MAG: Gfo/Idh/MocA family oxidoreductase [Lactobacillaceae bacterium]|jgi:predicted dehydrogenase|nr:Gfo/Idh/MocA family oxidoreductase [Lactobacillaceae bacterium]